MTLNGYEKHTISCDSIIGPAMQSIICGQHNADECTIDNQTAITLVMNCDVKSNRCFILLIIKSTVPEHRINEQKLEKLPIYRNKVELNFSLHANIDFR